MTSADVAALLGASPASVKRWADAGLLPCVRTPGRHRRFRRAEVERFRDHNPDTGHDPGHDAWVDGFIGMLLSDVSTIALAEALLVERARHGSWSRTAEALSSVLHQIGLRWRDGRMGVLQEHEASERLARALARCAEGLPPVPDCPRALLIAAEGEEHTLGLALVEMVVRERGLRAHWAGRRSPIESVVTLVKTGWIDVVMVSASAASTDRGRLEREAQVLEGCCREHEVDLLLGGAAPWPEHLTYARRVSSFVELEKFLAGLRT